MGDGVAFAKALMGAKARAANADKRKATIAKRQALLKTIVSAAHMVAVAEKAKKYKRVTGKKFSTFLPKFLAKFRGVFSRIKHVKKYGNHPSLASLEVHLAHELYRMGISVTKTRRAQIAKTLIKLKKKVAALRAKKRKSESKKKKSSSKKAKSGKRKYKKRKPASDRKNASLKTLQAAYEAYAKNGFKV